MKRPIVSLLMSFLMILSGCNRHEYSDKLISYTGEELFRMIVLFQGNENLIIKKLPEYEPILELISSLDDYQKDELNKFRDEMVNGIKKYNEDFFMSFKSSIESKDVIKIQNSLRDAGKYLFIVQSLSPKYNYAYQEANLFMTEIESENRDIDYLQLEKELYKKYKPLSNYNNKYYNEQCAVVALALYVAVAVALLLAAAVTHVVIEAFAAVHAVVVFLEPNLPEPRLTQYFDKPLTFNQELLISSIAKNF